MDVVFGTGTNNEPDWMTRVKGINGLRDYLKQDAVVKPIETIIVEGITEKELEKFDEAVSKYIVSEYNGMMPIAEYSIKGNPIMLSLAIKEYKITDKILDSIDNLTIHKCGRIAHNRNDGFSSIYSSGIYKNNEFSILNFLYLPSFIAEEKIRSRIIGRLADEADDLYDFSFEQTKTFNNDEVKQQLIADKKKHPKLFERKKVCYAYDMSSLFFLLQVFSDDDYVNQLLANNFVGLYSINDPQINQEVVVTEDMLILGKIVKRLQNQIDTHKELLCFMLKLVTELRRRNLLDNYSKKCWIDAEKTVWDNLMKLSVAEADLYALESDTNNKDYRAELIYEYAYRKSGKKMIFYMPDKLINIEYTFGLNLDTEYLYQRGIFFGTDTNDRKGRMLRLINDIDSIKYSDRVLQDSNKLGKEIGMFLSEQAKNLQDVFADLLIKGFVPYSCLDVVISRINKVKKCTYMRPLLVAYKFGGLHDDKG